MLLGDKTITVVNHWQQDGKTVYACHQLVNCSWYSQENRTADSPGQKPATIHRIRIPAAGNLDGYSSPGSWAALSSTTRMNFWTLGYGALLVLGNVYCTSDEEFQALHRSEACAGQLSWHDNTRGAIPHLYVEGS